MVLFERGLVRRHRGDGALAARVEGVALGGERLDALAVEDVLDRDLDRLEDASDGRGAAGVVVVGRPGLDHLADVVVELDQVDEDGPLDFQEQVLLVLLQLRVQPVDHPLARRLGASLALKDGLDRVELSRESIAQPFDGLLQAGNASRHDLRGLWHRFLDRGLIGPRRFLRLVADDRKVGIVIGDRQLVAVVTHVLGPPGSRGSQ